MERVGSYVLVQPIYRWGWADVFLAVEAPEGRAQRVLWWARLSPDLPWDDGGFVHRLQDLLSMFRQEIQDPILTLPTHWDFTAESPSMVFEPIPGKSLWEVLQAGRDQFLPMSIDQALACAHQLLMALQTLHSLTFQDQPVFHGLLSPAQVFVTYEGQLRLIYGGIPQALGEVGRVPASIRQALGPYLAPEQRDGLPGSQAADVYTASLVCLELLTNQSLEAPPADLTAWLMDQTVYLQTGEVAHLPEDLQMVFLQGLQADPRQRFQQISLLKEPLDEKAFSGEYEASTFHLAFYLNALFRDFPEREHRHYQSLLGQDYAALFTPPPPPPAEAPAVLPEAPPASPPEEVVLYPQVVPSEERPRRGFPLLPVLIALIILAFGGGAIWLLQRRMVAPPTMTPGPSPETVALRQQLEENQRRIAELQQIIQQLQATQSTRPAADSTADTADARLQELSKQFQELVKQNEELQRQLREKEKMTAPPPAPSPLTRAAKEESPESRPAAESSPAPSSPPTVEKAPSVGAPAGSPSPANAETKHEAPPSPASTTPVTAEAPSPAAPSPPSAKVEPESPPRAEPPPAPLPEFVLEVDLDVRIEPVSPCVSTDPRLNWIRNRYPGTHRVIGQIYLNESGQPLKVEILQAPVDLLREIARDAWMNCRFRRPTRNGQPVKAVITRVMVFGQ